MWYIKFSYDDLSTKETLTVSSLLQTSRHYLIGRSKNADFILPASESTISNNHATITVHEDGTAVDLEIYGKVTRVQGEDILRGTLSKEEAKVPTLRVLKGQTRIDLGRNYFSIHIYHKVTCLMVGRGVEVQEDALRRMGVFITADFTKATTHFVTEKKTQSTTQLEALIRQVPIVTPAFVSELVRREPDLYTDFEANLPIETAYLLDKQYEQNPGRKTLFQSHTLIFGNDSQYNALSPILTQAGANCTLFTFTSSPTATEYVHFVQQQQGTPILIQPPTQDVDLLMSHAELNVQTDEVRQLAAFNEGAKRLGRYLVTTQDVFNAVAQVSIDQIVRERPQRTKSPGLPDTSAPAPKKPRRAGRIKLLDSLDFFAGGGKMEKTSQPTQLQPLGEEPKEQSVSPKKKNRSRVKPMENQMLDTHFVPFEKDESSFPDPSPQSPAPMTESSTPAPPTSKPQEEVPDAGEEKKEEQAPLPSARPAKRKAETQSFSTAIIQAKKRAEERMDEQFPTLPEDEAVEHLRDLAIVEEKDMPLRQPRPTQTQTRDWRPEWEGRKNYKVFVKNTKGRGNPSVLLKEYVSFEVYDPRQAKLSERDEDMLDAVQRGQEGTFSFRSDTGAPVADREPTAVDPPQEEQREKLFVSDDDDDLGFHFTTDGGDEALGMSALRVAERDNTPEYRRSIVDTQPAQVQPLRQQSSKASRKPTTRQPSRLRSMAEEDEDDDDDDDVPRFRFRR